MKKVSKRLDFDNMDNIKEVAQSDSKLAPGISKKRCSQCALQSEDLQNKKSKSMTRSEDTYQG